MTILTIAGLNVWLDQPNVELSPEYRQFISEQDLADAHCPVDLQINFTSTTCVTAENEGPPDYAGSSWSVSRNEGVVTIRLGHLPNKTDTHWAARYEIDKNLLTVYESPERMASFENKAAFHFGYPLDQIILMVLLSYRHGALFHAAGLMHNKNTYIFPGKSGAGKSTFCKLLEQAPEFTLLSDDRIIVRNMAGQFHAFGTPWPGEAHIARNHSGPLAGILFLEKSDRTVITPLSKKQAFQRLMPITSIQWFDPDHVDKLFTICERLVESVPAFELSFARSTRLIDELHRFITA